MIEGGLHRLLALYLYDVKALAEQIHRPLAPRETEEAALQMRRKGAVKRLPYRPKGDARRSDSPSSPSHSTHRWRHTSTLSGALDNELADCSLMPKGVEQFYMSPESVLPKASRLFADM